MLFEIALAAPGVALGAAPSLLFRALARGRIYEIERAPRREVALVLGARLLAPGVPTTLLLHRLLAARELWESGRAGTLLLSGLSGEVEAMRSWLLARSVPERALWLDRESARTLHSLVRARAVFGLREVAVVTNPFHLPRALFLARRAGLSAIGIAARSGPRVARATLLKNQAREAAASLRAAWECRKGIRQGAE